MPPKTGDSKGSTKELKDLALLTEIVRQAVEQQSLKVDLEKLKDVLDVPTTSAANMRWSRFKQAHDMKAGTPKEGGEGDDGAAKAVKRTPAAKKRSAPAAEGEDSPSKKPHTPRAKKVVKAVIHEDPDETEEEQLNTTKKVIKSEDSLADEAGSENATD